MRKYHIDNLRWAVVLFLFPYHTFMVYNHFGDDFYVKGAALPFAGNVIIATWPFLMPLMFLLAGVSSYYALQKRSTGEYCKERVKRLLIPFLAGVLLLVPSQTYFAERFHNGYTGGYVRQYLLFFTKPTDLSGNTGGFTPGQLWFILFLFVISLLTLPLLHWRKQSGKQFAAEKIPLPLLLLFFLIPSVSQIVLDFGGKSLGEYSAFFLLGYFVVAREALQQKLEKYRWLLLALALCSMIPYTFFGRELEAKSTLAYEALYGFYAWAAVLALLGLGRRYFAQHNKLTAYLSGASFGIYEFHQQWLVMAAFFALRWTGSVPLQLAMILAFSVGATFLQYELFRRWSVTRFLFGLK